MAKIKVFVSYSHADLPLVAPVVALLRANRSFVFRDSDTIRPGKKWRNEIFKSIQEANLVILFWCLHSSRSVEVEKEYAFAISNGKDILPLLLDETPLHPSLQEYQWIDFQAVVSANHAKLGADRVRSNRWPYVGCGVALFLLIIGFSAMFSLRPVIPTTLPAFLWDWLFSSPIASFLKTALQGPYAVLVALAVILLWIIGWLILRQEVKSASQEPEHLLARAIQAEMIRRTDAKRT